MTTRTAGSILVIASVVLALLGPAAHAAGDAAAGRRKAVQCQTCHGLDGLSKTPEAPNLAGQPEPYLVKSLNDFRQGVRKNEMMSIVSQALSDADVADLAAYYAAIEIITTPNP
ncbi:MAG TPA: cytochrome c [Pseudolabrys sp.]|jgi:cytochrome c553